VNWAADAMVAGGKKRCPGYLQFLNVPRAYAKTATELLCFLPMLKRRKSEDVTDEQLELEWTLMPQSISLPLR